MNHKLVQRLEFVDYGLDCFVSPMNLLLQKLPSLRRLDAAGHTENKSPPGSLTPPLIRGKWYLRVGAFPSVVPVLVYSTRAV